MNKDFQKLFENVPPDVLQKVVSDVIQGTQEPTEQAEKLQKALENIRTYYDDFLPNLLGKEILDPQEVVKLLVDHCSLEKNMSEGLEFFNTKLQENGLQIEMDQEKYNKWGERLSNLRFYRQLIHVMGLGAFEDELMAIEIKRLEPFPNEQSKVMEMLQNKIKQKTKEKGVV